jgi:predicted dehydrogenase
MSNAPAAPVRVGLVGAGFMGRTHSVAYGALRALYGDATPVVARVRIAAPDPARARAAARRFGWGDAASDWRAVTRGADIDVVDVATPNDTHAEIAIDALEHGKHVLCEKPMAHTVAAARGMLRAAERSQTVAQVGFVFRKWPAMALARKLIEDGRLGRVLQFRAHYFHDYALAPDLAVTWRLRRARAGAGSIGDIGCHLIDLARYLVGDIDRVLARSRVFYPRRPLSGSAPAEAVDVDDATDLLVEFDGGAIGMIQTNWMAAGYKTDLTFEVSGEAGAVRFTWRRNAELEFYSHLDAPDTDGFRQVIIGPQHRGAEAFWPVAGKALGYGDAFVIQARDLLDSITHGVPVAPSFLDGLRVSEVVNAALRSSESGAWTTVERDGATSAPGDPDGVTRTPGEQPAATLARHAT